MRLFSKKQKPAEPQDDEFAVFPETPAASSNVDASGEGTESSSQQSGSLAQAQAPPQQSAGGGGASSRASTKKKPKKGSSLGFGSKKKPSKPATVKSELDHPTPPPAKAKRRFGFGRKKLGPLLIREARPTELVHIDGERVLVPAYEDIEKYGSIVYPVREPYQFVNLQINDGELVYRALEPKLTAYEKEILKKAANAFDMLVNVGSVLTTAEDKLQFLEETFRDIMKLYNMQLSEVEYRRVLYNIERDYVGYGRVDLLIRDRLIEDISCNGPDSPVFIYHRFFESIRTNIIFDEVELNNFILRLAQLSGRHISILQPIRDAALPDGSRINMTLGKEVTKKGSTFTIRKFRSEPISPIELILLRTGDVRVFAYLWVLIEYGRSLLISGGTAAGKTTLLNALSMLIKPENKIVSVEDTPEINLAHPNWIQAVTRVGFGEAGAPSGVSGISGIGHATKSAGDINLFDLLIAALRQRPDFIIVGEVRGEEAYTLFQAISVGHATMGTIHAASMTELLARVESQPMNVPRVMVANLDLVIFVAAMRKGDEKVRRIREMVEILGVNAATKELITNTVFSWDPNTDFYQFNGRSFLIEKICKANGIPLDKLNKEVENRVLLFEKMIKQGITNYKAITDIVRQYYLDKEAVVGTEDLASLVTVRTGETPMWGTNNP
jgi:archaeal flagellar protein FlaI